MATKKVTLVAKCLIAYEGERYGDGMQFTAREDDPVAHELVRSGQAEAAPEAPPKTRRAAAHAEEPAAKAAHK